MNARSVAIDAPPALSMVNVSVVVLPGPIVDGWNDLSNVGCAEAATADSENARATTVARKDDDIGYQGGRPEDRS